MSPFFFNNEDSYTDKTTYLYWDGPRVSKIGVHDTYRYWHTPTVLYDFSFPEAWLQAHINKNWYPRVTHKFMNFRYTELVTTPWKYLGLDWHDAGVNLV